MTTDPISETLAAVRPVVTAACRRARVPERYVEDVAQEALIDLWRALSASRVPEGAVAAWATTIAKRRSVDHFRRIGCRPTDLYADVPDRGVTTDGPDIADDATVAEVARVLAPLTDEQRTLLWWRYADGIPSSTVAEQLGVTPMAVRMRTHHTLRTVRRSA